MADKIGEGGVVYRKAEAGYFEKRGFRRYAGVWSLWALGVGAVISGHYSGWNLGLATGGWGGMLVAGIIIMVMYLGLVFCIAEMAPALPHTGAAYSFARSAMGPWGGFITGLCENVEYVLTPAVIVFFIGSYMGAIFGTPPEFQPVWWVLMYALVLGAQHCRGGTLLQGHSGGDVGGACRADHFLGQRLSASRFQPLGVEYRARRHRAARRQRPIFPVRHPWRPRHAALCGMAVPGDRAAASRG